MRSKSLEAERVGMAGLHAPMTKPLDTKIIVREARRNGCTGVVAEN
jgi:transketolase C-terminal domain/subunit